MALQVVLTSALLPSGEKRQYANEAHCGWRFGGGVDRHPHRPLPKWSRRLGLPCRRDSPRYCSRNFSQQEKTREPHLRCRRQEPGRAGLSGMWRDTVHCSKNVGRHLRLEFLCAKDTGAVCDLRSAFYSGLTVTVRMTNTTCLASKGFSYSATSER